MRVRATAGSWVRRCRSYLPPPHLKHNRISRPPLGIACPIAPRRCIGALVLDEVQFGNRVFSDVIPFPSAGIDAPDFQYSRRSEEHTSELQSLMRISYAVFCLKKKKTHRPKTTRYQ